LRYLSLRLFNIFLLVSLAQLGGFLESKIRYTVSDMKQVRTHLDKFMQHSGTCNHETLWCTALKNIAANSSQVSKRANGRGIFEVLGGRRSVLFRRRLKRTIGACSQRVSDDR